MIVENTISSILQRLINKIILSLKKISRELESLLQSLILFIIQRLLHPKFKNKNKIKMNHYDLPDRKVQ